MGKDRLHVLFFMFIEVRIGVNHDGIDSGDRRFAECGEIDPF